MEADEACADGWVIRLTKSGLHSPALPVSGVRRRRRGFDQAYRTISTGKLHVLPRFHTQPIDVVVFHGSQRVLVLRGASRLDAFSGYPVRA